MTELVRAWSRGEYQITTDRSRVDVDAVHRYLSVDSYWAKNIPREIVERSIQHSMCFAILRGDLPINREMAAWAADAPPSDWQRTRARWERFFAVRTVAATAAFGCVAIAVLS